MFVDLDVHQGDGTAAIFRDGELGGRLESVASWWGMAENTVCKPSEFQPEPHSSLTYISLPTIVLDPSVFTFSMHCRDQGFPSQLQQSDLDIALPAGTGDQEYLVVN
jgi:acetoin utilization deacetylase AcuC-like enzyme